MVFSEVRFYALIIVLSLVNLALSSSPLQVEEATKRNDATHAHPGWKTLFPRFESYSLGDIEVEQLPVLRLSSAPTEPYTTDTLPRGLLGLRAPDVCLGQDTCDSQHYCCNSHTCCTIFSAISCCPGGYRCGNNECVANNICSEKVPCGTGCCNSGDSCCGGGTGCCKWGTQCCGNKCCSAGSQCQSGNCVKAATTTANGLPPPTSTSRTLNGVLKLSDCRPCGSKSCSFDVTGSVNPATFQLMVGKPVSNCDPESTSNITVTIGGTVIIGETWSVDATIGINFKDLTIGINGGWSSSKSISFTQEMTFAISPGEMGVLVAYVQYKRTSGFMRVDPSDAALSIMSNQPITVIRYDKEVVPCASTFSANITDSMICNSTRNFSLDTWVLVIFLIIMPFILIELA